MRIEMLEYHDKALGWKLEPLHFSNLNLLVGVSGVGKTQILNAILDLKNMTNGSPLNGVEWDITFLTDNDLYRWQGEFESKGSDELYDLLNKDEDEQDKNRSKIIYEKLFLNQELIVDRNGIDIILRGRKTPKLSPFESVAFILDQEEEIAPVRGSFNKIHFDDPETSLRAIRTMLAFQFNELVQEYQSLKTIQDSSLNIHLKLALVYKNVPEIFEEIKKHFIDIFPQVEDIKLEPVKRKGWPEFWGEFPFIYIKEKWVNNWIHQATISSGMLKSLIHIGEIYLLPEGSVILIDEFENSLGINCIDVLTENLLVENRTLQFIITSHHPYIINNIGMEHWKIVTRKGGIVTVKDAKDLNLGKSRHDAFIQLINLESYKEGIAS